MQRITGPAAWRELRGLAAGTPGLCAWKRGWTGGGQPALRRHWAGVSARPARPFSMEPGRRTGRRRVAFIGERQRLFSSQPGGDDGPPGGSDRQPSVSVVGIPDPITWIRCKVITYLIDLYFDTDINSVEFERGIKQVTTDTTGLLPTMNNKHEEVVHLSTGFGPRLRQDVQRQISRAGGDRVRRDGGVRGEEVPVARRRSAAAARRQNGRYHICASRRRLRRLRSTR
ncbi:uncharacterized protein [Embiotoca jacksoni]|uniref:uncharacterized protein isoform X3 n=1 Tax=Embiotoca jacksoni TaxID=100190 RepID=UPI0037038A8A